MVRRTLSIVALVLALYFNYITYFQHTIAAYKNVKLEQRHPYLKMYTQVVYDELQKRGYKARFVPIVEKDLMPGVIGKYVGLKFKRFEAIYINLPRIGTPEILESTILHELGHAFGLAHDDRMMIDGCPLSVMHSVNSMHICFTRHYEYYYGTFIENVTVD
jgi:hypothetical protein